MEIISLDTSVFVKENFLEGKRIEAIFDLCKKGHFKLVLSIITVNELKSQFRKQCQQAIELPNKVINDKKDELRVLRNNAAAKHILQKFPKLDEICNEFNEKIETSLKEISATILDYPTLNIGGVFDDYFNDRAPFKKTDKKHEFPDAFALAHLEQWCKENNTKCIVFSVDKDFSGFKSSHVTVKRDYEKYLENYLKRIDPKRTEMLEMLFVKNSENINNEVKQWLYSELDDYSVYHEHTNWLDVHDIDIKGIEIVNKTYEIVALHDETIEIEIVVTVRVNIVLTIDDEESRIYDDDDKEYHYMYTTELPIESDEIEIPLIASFYIVDENDFDDKYEIEEINDGNKIELPVDRWDY